MILAHFRNPIKMMLLFFILVHFGIACNERSDTAGRKTVFCDSTVYLRENECNSLHSLKKLDDYPFYTMTYYGDYGFEEYLKSGRFEDQAETISDSGDHSYQCTCFAVRGPDGVMFGRNFDWHHRASMLLFTDSPKGYASVSMVDLYYLNNGTADEYETIQDRLPLLRAPRFPFDGMNEKGVAIGIMAVPHAEPPYEPKKRSIYDLAVVRLVLDYAATTEEAIALINQYNVELDEVNLHFMIADRSGKSVIIEFINHQTKVIRSAESYQVSTNFIIDETKPVLTGHCWRYDTCWNYLTGNHSQMTLNNGMDLLQQVSQSNTRWSMIYDLSDGGIIVSVGRQYDDRYTFSLNR